MSHTLSLRLPKDLAQWIKETAKATGQTQGAWVRAHLEKARGDARQKPWLALAGAAKGLPADLSLREGFAKR